MNEKKDNNQNPEEIERKDLTKESIEKRQDAAKAAEDVQKARAEFEGGKVGVEHPHEEKDTSYMDKKPPKITVWKIVKYTVYAIILFVFLLLIYRIFVQDRDYNDYLVWTEEAVEAYEEHGKLTVWTQEMSSFTFALERDENNIPIEDSMYKYTYSPFSANRESERNEFNGVFKVSGPMYIEETKQFIFTFRVNRKADERLQAYYNLPTNPQGDVYIFTLEDNHGNAYTDYEYVTFSEDTYYYYRLVFNDVSYPFYQNYLEVTQDDIVEISLNIFYKELFNESSPFDTMTVGNNLVTPDRFDLDDALPAKVPSDLKPGYAWKAKDED